MSFIRHYPTQDTSIANADPSVNDKDIRYANVGASEILNLYQTSEQNATASVLINFPTATPAAGETVWLKLFDAQHAETLPYGYTVWVHQLTQSWTEGTGLDMDYYTDLGVANDLSATLTTPWLSSSLTGAVSFSFANGHEDLEADVTVLTPSPFGFHIHISESFSDLYIKKFHSRQTHFPTKRPYLEYRLVDPTGTLSTKTVYTANTASYMGVEIDPTKFLSSTLAALSGSGTVLLSQTWVSNVDPTGALVASIPNLKPVYDASEAPKLQLQVQLKDWNPATALTASSVTPNVVLTKVYYRITDVITDEVLVPFADYTRTEYGDAGNWFSLNMASLPTGSLFQIDLRYEAPSGVFTLFPGTANRFRVISHG